MKNTLLILAIVAAWASSITAQDKYIRLTDASGFNTDSYQAALQLAADSLVSVFPAVTTLLNIKKHVSLVRPCRSQRCKVQGFNLHLL